MAPPPVGAGPSFISVYEQTRLDAGAGYLAGTVTEFLLYPIGSYKTQQQSGMKPLDRRLMVKGMFSLPLLGIAPSLATFFALYTPLKTAAGDSAVGVLAASVAAAVPASGIRIPADVLQKRVVLGVDRVSVCLHTRMSQPKHRRISSLRPLVHRYAESQITGTCRTLK